MHQYYNRQASEGSETLSGMYKFEPLYMCIHLYYVYMDVREAY